MAINKIESGASGQENWVQGRLFEPNIKLPSYSRIDNDQFAGICVWQRNDGSCIGWLMSSIVCSTSNGMCNCRMSPEMQKASCRRYQPTELYNNGAGI